MTLRRMLLAGAALAALVLAGTAFPASTGSVKITTIGGQTVKNGTVSRQISGNVAVAGTAALAGQEAAPAAKPLVADAGDTPFAPVGQPATLLGAGYGGAEPYTFSWSASAGTLAGADAPTAQLSNAPAGTHLATLTVRDAKGETATDTVKVIVYQPERRTLLDQTKADPTPGVTGTGLKVEFPFDVPAATSVIDVKISWGLPVNDYDLRVLDPKGSQRASHGDGVPTTEENAGVSNPEPGTWTAVADKFGTVTDSVRAVVTGTVAPNGDPRPEVVSGGPYTFAIGAAQNLNGTVTGGAAPVTVAWDPDSDGVFESSGPDITTEPPRGTPSRHAEGDRREWVRAARDDLTRRRGSVAARRRVQPGHRHRGRGQRHQRVPPRVLRCDVSRSGDPEADAQLHRAPVRVHPGVSRGCPGDSDHAQPGLLPAAGSRRLGRDRGEQGLLDPWNEDHRRLRPRRVGV